MQSKTKEWFYRDKLCKSYPGSKTEVRCDHGLIDVLTPDEVIEVKRLKDFKSALGQVVAYGHCYPDRGKRIHLICPSWEAFCEVEEVIERCCKPLGIRVTMEEEVDVEIPVYRIGEEVFETIDAVNRRVSAIRTQYTAVGQQMEEEHEMFIRNLVNIAPWVSRKFGGLIEYVRVVPDNYRNGRRLSVGHFQVKTAEGKWCSISIKNYISCLPREAQEGVKYELKSS